MACYWWNRWLHRRRREADVLFLLPALRLRAEMASKEAVFTEAWSRDIDRRIDAAMALHKTLPGNEHWHCECSQETMERQG